MLKSKIISENKYIDLINELGSKFLIAGCDKNWNKVLIIDGSVESFGCMVVGKSWQDVYYKTLTLLLFAYFIVRNGVNLK